MSSLIISLTTIHSRVDKIHLVIESLLNQQTSIDFEVRLYISDEAYLLDKGINNIPDTLQRVAKNSDGRFNVFYTQNIGPYRKFLPLLKEYFADKIDFTYLVTVDDDTVYPDNWLQGLIEANQKHNCVVAYRGRQLVCDEESVMPYNTWIHSDSTVLQPSLKTVGTGKDGILYRPEYFHPDIVDIEQALAACNHADDLWLKVHTAINGVPSVLLAESLEEAFQDLGEEDDNTLYRKINKFGGNDVAMSNLHRYFLNRYRLNLLDVFNLNLSKSSTWLNPHFLNSYY
ncbi:glycosyltransferase [Alteromonas ponticola]|uniref:Glycosyltransferase n=1 Tax=Alteromonas ponticola TaxID=2720613 RepID=A0ABX1R2Q2_9ALTE|nr:glycosyltransferase [Alteromonas ponticola]NMH60191.1 glycosyltransferase [Alteromonas ponticola]